MDRFMQAHVPLLVLADSDLVVVSCMFRLRFSFNMRTDYDDICFVHMRSIRGAPVEHMVGTEYDVFFDQLSRHVTFPKSPDKFR